MGAPAVRTKARFLHAHRLVTWAEPLLQPSPAGGAKSGSRLARLRACLSELPTCKALIKRFQADAQGWLASQEILKTKGLSHDTLAQCQSLIGERPSAPMRQEVEGYLKDQLATAKTLGLDQLGWPISPDLDSLALNITKPYNIFININNDYYEYTTTILYYLYMEISFIVLEYIRAYDVSNGSVPS